MYIKSGLWLRVLIHVQQQLDPQPSNLLNPVLGVEAIRTDMENFTLLDMADDPKRAGKASHRPLLSHEARGRHGPDIVYGEKV